MGVAGTVVAILGVLLCGQAAGQILHAKGSRPSFQVATIKRSSSTETRSAMGFSAGGRGFTTTNATLRDLIQEAYNVKAANQIAGAAGWMTAEKFDLEARMDDDEVASVAKLPIDARVDQVRLMLQSLLAERFALKLSESSRVSSYFVLVMAKGGPMLKPTADTAGSGTGQVRWRGPGKIEATAVTMPMLADTLGRMRELGAEGGFTMGELIVDKTGLTGRYDWTLTWAPDVGADTAAAGGPDLFTAIQEQLGLKLEKAKAQVEVLVIEHAERPSEN
jgi:uncharacterized protein (TIGR03435 family)